MNRGKKGPKALITSFLVDWGTYGNETLVCVGLDKEAILRRLSRMEGAEGGEDSLSAHFSANATDHDFSGNGFFFRHGGKSLIWMKPFHDAWPELETLMHEIHHAVHFILGSDKGMHKEAEALAYQQQYLFRKVRRRLQDMYHAKR